MCLYRKKDKGGTTMGAALLAVSIIMLIRATDNAVVVNKEQQEMEKSRTIK